LTSSIEPSGIDISYKGSPNNDADIYPNVYETPIHGDNIPVVPSGFGNQT